MSTNRETEIRERMTRHWLAAERSVRAYIAGAVSSFADREDLLQQVALTVARRFEEFDEQRSFLAWVLWLTRSRITDFYRARGKHSQLLSGELLEQYAERLVQRHAGSSRRSEALQTCLEQLSERSRTLLQLKYHDGLKTEQIAAALKSTPASVRVTLYRVRETLAACIQRKLAPEAVE
ncbi:MAG: polymerase sigma factor SigD [Planctomycetota bacterium]|jgi:RNA polymerase sigma-70 factor (ECF subfamily)